MKFHAMGILAAAFALAACQTDGPKDSGGSGMKLSEPKPMLWSESETNLPLFFASSNINARSVVRDNGGVFNDRFGVGGRTFAEIQFVPISWFSDVIVTTYNDVNRFNSFAARVGRSGVTPIKASTVNNELVGYYGKIGSCWVVRVAARLKPQTIYSGDRGGPDAALTASGCGGIFNKPIEDVLKGWRVNDDETKAKIKAHRSSLPAPAAPPQSSGPSSLSVSHLGDRDICINAIDRQSKKWEDRSSYTRHVAEAKKRGFSEAKCVSVITGR